MAGWSMLSNGDCAATTDTKFENRVCFEIDNTSLNPGVVDDVDDDFKDVNNKGKDFLFYRYQNRSVFTNEVATRNGDKPIPPKLWDGRCVDLFRLFWVVREKGGFELVTKNGLWGLVTDVIGLKGGIGISSGVKMIYIKYLGELDHWFDKHLTIPQTQCGSAPSCSFKELANEAPTGSDSEEAKNGYVNYKHVQNGIVLSEVISVDKKGIDSRKRKHDSLYEMLNWVTELAKHPCDYLARNESKGILAEAQWARQVLLLRKHDDSKVDQSALQKRRWGDFWNLYWCFGSNKHNKRIGHAVLVPEPLVLASTTEVPGSENLIQGPTRVLPCAAPPSSPASFFQSEPPSATQSSTGSLSVAANMDSPSGPRSIFAIGPYAHETQLVSPPVFSTGPSTAPFTPPPESLQLTTPSSPDVPFAQLVDPNYRNSEGGTRFPQSHYEFQSYQLYPGSSPVGQLISPSSCISESGTSSPFPDYLEFQSVAPPRLLSLDKLANDDWGSRLGSGSLTPKSRGSSILERENSQSLNQPESDNVDSETAEDHRVSFELKPEIRCIEQRTGSLTRAVLASLQNQQTLKSAKTSSEVDFHEYHFGATNDTCPSEWEEGQQRPEKHRSMTLGSIKEFNFDNVEANDKAEDQPNQNWSFFPMLQPRGT